MTDIEGNARPATAPPSNPYSSSGGVGTNVVAVLPAHHPLNIIKRLAYIGISLYSLQRFFQFHLMIFQSPHIRHEWFKVGLAATIGA